MKPLRSILASTVLLVALAGCSGASSSTSEAVHATTGPSGAPGQQGATGEQGDQGIPGLQGIQGLSGDKGEIGLTGATGSAGSTGPQGIQGSPGQQGIQGPAGTPGAAGSVVATGPTGAQGPPGPAGTSAIVGYDFIGSLMQSPAPTAYFGIDSYMGAVSLPANGDYQLTIRVESDRPIRCSTVGGQFYGPNSLGREFFYSQLQSIPNPDVYLVQDIQVLWTNGSPEIVELYCQSVDPSQYDATVSRALFIATKIG